MRTCIQFNLLSTFQSSNFIADFFPNLIQKHIEEEAFSFVCVK